jgi:Icc-related predicted phosphoesterase
MPRLVLISDTHGLGRPFIPDGDILIHAGDLTMMGRTYQIEDVGNWLRSLPHKHKIVIAGNHDWLFERSRFDAVNALGRGIIYLENSSVTVEGLKFYGSPVTPWFNDWAFNIRGSTAIRPFWDAIPSDTDVLITHGPPIGVLDQVSSLGNTEHLGCGELLMAILRIRPKIHVFGHIHGGYGRHETKFGTVCYNASMSDESYKLVHKPWVVDL